MPKSCEAETNGDAVAFPGLCKVRSSQMNDLLRQLTSSSRSEFHKHRDVGKKDFGTIEYLLRRGRNQLETWSEPGIRDIHR
ncbi:hypothetical protein J4E90_002713 [Alternaria incomplexa]|uniref:uncharacterized protein n=1 Tax=Alternaria incomplexa TaxID=1187928 RepID=UPI002220626B|nr:uncharacterized protein J4E90_002713 [Alternaria incomplexa]XP_051326515.1 uncharacterized protein J4E85_005438 [Alternaria conjuncta]KAI4918329.1 hypothetical protein J4E90_002713 [Alternaria incomplexa]KAI4928817.1 hypothetical protein J4E85_005438 [Alternaria conjuncta]